MTINEFWNVFLLETGKDQETKYTGTFHFEITEKLANQLLKLVLLGEKKLHQVVYMHMN